MSDDISSTGGRGRARSGVRRTREPQSFGAPAPMHPAAQPLAAHPLYLRAMYLSTVKAITRARDLASSAELAVLDGVDNGLSASALSTVHQLQQDAVHSLAMGLFFARLYVAAARSSGLPDSPTAAWDEGTR